MSFLEAVGTGHTFTGLDGKEYTLSPLMFKELGEFVRWVQYKPYYDAKEAKLPKELCDEILAECRRGKVTEKSVSSEWLEANKDDKNAVPLDEDFIEKEFPIGLDSTVVRKAMVTGEGLQKLFTLSLSVRHPEFKIKPINAIVNLSEFKNLHSILLVMNGLSDDEEDEAEDDEDSEKN